MTDAPQPNTTNDFIFPEPGGLPPALPTHTDADTEDDGDDVRSEDSKSVGSLRDFLVEDDAPIARLPAPCARAELKRSFVCSENIVSGKRQRRAVTRFVEEFKDDILPVYLEGMTSAEAASVLAAADLTASTGDTSDVAGPDDDKSVTTEDASDSPGTSDDDGGDAGEEEEEEYVFSGTEDEDEEDDDDDDAFDDASSESMEHEPVATASPPAVGTTAVQESEPTTSTEHEPVATASPPAVGSTAVQESEPTTSTDMTP